MELDHWRCSLGGLDQRRLIVGDAPTYSVGSINDAARWSLAKLQPGLDQ